MKIKQEVDEEMSVANKLNAQRLGMTLRNLLKLPKAHKWVCFEFFYSNIDKYEVKIIRKIQQLNFRVLFQGENDFIMCLRESFPQLKTRRLARVEWSKVGILNWNCYNPLCISRAYLSNKRIYSFVFRAFSLLCHSFIN